MPTFGEFETYGQPYAVSDARSHVATIWQARKAGAVGEPLYAVKCYAPRGSATSQSQPEEALAHDRRLEFLEGIKQIKKAQTEGGRGLAPIHALGTSATEAWYVTDFYKRKDLQAWIDRKGEVDGAALRHVVYSVVTACLALKRSRGCSHGNLKPSNIFLAGKPRDLRKTPLLLTDAYPAAPLQLARLEADDRHEAGELLHQVMEAQDLAALGQLILQLVEGRLLSRSDDYNYPVERSPAWDAVGKDGDYWLQWCNKLLNPQLSLETINLETLATEFKPIKSPLPLIAGVIVGVCLLALGSYFAVKGWQQWREIKYQSVVPAAGEAPSTHNPGSAREQVERARKLRPEDPGAITLEAQIQEQIDRSYTAAIQAATTASSNGNHRETTNQAGIALSFKPGDPAARNWMSNGQKGIENEASEAQRAANCSHAKTGAREAESQPNWPLALEYWQRAQRFCTNEPAIANDIAFVTAMATAHALLGQAQTKTTSAPEAATNLCAQALKALPAQVLYAGNSERTTAAGALKVEVDKARAAAEAESAKNINRQQCNSAKKAAREAEATKEWATATSKWREAQRQCGTEDSEVKTGLAFVTAMATAHALLGQAQTKTTSAPEAATNLCAQALKALPAQVLYAGNSERTTAAGALKVEVDKARAAAEAESAKNINRQQCNSAKKAAREAEATKEWATATSKWREAQRQCGTEDSEVKTGLAFVTAMATAHALLGQAQTKRQTSEEHTSELQSPMYLVCRLLL